MKILNIYQIPDAVYRACAQYIRKPKKYSFSITELISPPQIRYLKMQHWDELEEDASARLWALLGSAIHSVVSQHSVGESLSEEKLEMVYNYQGQDYTIKGVPDLLIENELVDFKVTSVWSFLLGEKQEWEKQLNLYALLYKHYGFDVNKISIWAILRDWNASKAQQNNEYPPIPFMKINMKLWSDEEQKAFLEKCLADHLQTPPRPCSPEEQWAKPTTFAVMKTGRKTAIRICKTEDEAKEIIEQQKDTSKHNYYIQKREGIKVRCHNYCVVSKFCEQFQKEGVQDEDVDE